MEKFNEEKANSIVNETILEQEFGINTSDRRQQDILEIKQMRQQLETISNDNPDPDKILYSNIERANDLLDIAQRSIKNGGETSARLFEVCAQLINAITTATASISGNSFGNLKHQYNMEMLRVKEREIEVKEIIAREKSGQKLSGGKSGTVVVMDRESLLKMIEDDDSDVVVQSSVEEEQQ